jgi:hypothetical protein
MNEQQQAPGAQYHSVCNDVINILRHLVPSDQVLSHFRSARVEVMKGFRQMIDDRIARAESANAKGTRVPVD